MCFRRPSLSRMCYFALVLTVPLLVSLLTLVFTVAPAAGDCTTFALGAGESLVYGRNMDYEYEHGLILVNKRNVIKTAFVRPELGDPKPARWTSKYGSVTVSNVGREFPDTGMNEVGLALCETTLNESRFPDPDDREAVNAVQWIQYQLDSFATVKEVLANVDAVRAFLPGKRGHHYFLCDASGDCATVEYLNARVVAHRRQTLPVAVLTNDTYEASRTFLGKHVGFGGSAAIPQDHSSLARFVRAADLLRSYDQSLKPVGYAFRVLGAVAQGQSTKRSIVFDIRVKRFYFRTLSHPAIKFINLADLDYGCDTPMMILDTRRSDQGDVTAKLKTYTDKAHEDFLRNVLNDNAELRQIVGDPDTFVQGITRYYNTLKPRRDAAGQRNSRAIRSGNGAN